jgi:hypothetical protein
LNRFNGSESAVNQQFNVALIGETGECTAVAGGIGPGVFDNPVFQTVSAEARGFAESRRTKVTCDFETAGVRGAPVPSMTQTWVSAMVAPVAPLTRTNVGGADCPGDCAQARLAKATARTMNRMTSIGS